MVEEEIKEIKFIDAEQYSGGNFDKITFRDIILNHLKKICQNANVEFRGGHWEEHLIAVGGQIVTNRIYIPDTREVYSNSVEVLSDLCFPHFDKKMIEDEKAIRKELETAYKKYTVEEVRNDSTTEEKERTFRDIDYRLSFRTKRRELCRELLRALSSFLKRVDYFKTTTFEETT